MIDALEALFAHRGAEAYFGEAVTVGAHMLQCAALARAEDAPGSLVAAALLHDIGHLLDPRDYQQDETFDRRHELAGAAFLKRRFPLAVVEPIRLHVAAKRYLCATDPAYLARLSPASHHSLALQGGPMCGEETAAFERQAFSRDAVRIRRWDDAGKVDALTVHPFAAYRGLLATL